MDWATLLRMPMTVLLVLAAIFLLVSLVQLVALRQRLHTGDATWPRSGARCCAWSASRWPCCWAAPAMHCAVIVC
jgi:hypothetical protein